jgi:hypothetical protein
MGLDKLHFWNGGMAVCCFLAAGAKPPDKPSVFPMLPIASRAPRRKSKLK